MPSPYVAHNHQELNAQVLEKKGAAVILHESDLSGKRLKDTIDSIVRDEGKLRSMRKASRSLGMTEACEKIYEAVRAH